MNTERIVRMVAGFMVTASVALGYFHSPWWFLLTLFVGLNLFQSAFTQFCPLEIILNKWGISSCSVPNQAKESTHEH